MEFHEIGTSEKTSPRTSTDAKPYTPTPRVNLIPSASVAQKEAPNVAYVYPPGHPCSLGDCTWFSTL